MDVMTAIQQFNAGRDPVRLAMKLDKMSANPFAFLRGSCHLFYAQLKQSGPLKKAPLVWSCGDLHLENFGSYKGDNRETYSTSMTLTKALWPRPHGIWCAH